MNFDIAHTFYRIDRAAYEALFFDEAFNQALKPAAGLKARALLEERREGDCVVRRVQVWPERDFPGPLKKLLTGELSYTETSRFDPGRHRASFTSQTSLLTDKIHLSGEIIFEALEGGVRRRVQGEVRVDIFGLGKVIEKAVVDNLRETFDKIARFTQAHIDAGGRG